MLRNSRDEKLLIERKQGVEEGRDEEHNEQVSRRKRN